MVLLVNFEKWKKMPLWKVWEAVMLFSGYEPTDQGYGLYALMKQRHKLEAESDQYDNVFFSYDFLTRAIRVGDLSYAAQFQDEPMDVEARPADFISVAKKHDISIPEKLKDIEQPISEMDFGKMPYLNPDHDFYSERLAAAVHAWQAIDQNPELLEHMTPKQAVNDWLKKNREKYNLSDKAIDQISSIANWKKGGPTITPA